MNRLLLATVIMCVSCLSSDAQEKLTLKKVMTLKMGGETGANGASVAWHPTTKRYYAAMAGNESYPTCVFNEKGQLLTDGVAEAMIDVRGLWFNPKNSTIQGNGYNDYGWFEYKLNEKGIPVEVKALHEGMNQPHDQCLGVYNSKLNEVYFFDGNDFYAYDATTAEVKQSTNLEQILKYNDLDPESVGGNYNPFVPIFTGIKDKEIGLLNVVDNQVELFRKDWKRTVIIAVPEDQPVYEMFNFSYTNGMYWFFNKETRTWTGYKTAAATK